MLRPTAVAFVALLAITAAACSPTSNADEDPSHPDWLVFTLTGPASLGNYSRQIELHADGTALSTDEIWHEYEIEDDYTAMTWTFDGQTLTVGGQTAVFAAGCHLVEIVDAEYPSESLTYWLARSGSIDGCPQSETALSDAERALVDSWSDKGLLVTFDESRYVIWNLDEVTHYYRWALDDDGTTFHLTNPDGTDEPSGTSVVTGDTLKICMAGDCRTLTRFNP